MPGYMHIRPFTFVLPSHTYINIWNTSFTHVTDDSGHPNCLHGWRECGRLSQLCRASWHVTVGPLFLHWVNTSHLSSQVESHWPVWGHTLTHNQWYVLAPNSLLGWDVESRCWREAPRAAQFLPSMPLLWRFVLSVLLQPLYCADSLLWGCVFVVGAGVGASRGIPVFKWAWGRLPGGPEDSLTKTTCCSNNQSNQTTRQPLWYILNDLLPSAFPPSKIPVSTNDEDNTLQKLDPKQIFFYRVVKLILQRFTHVYIYRPVFHCICFTCAWTLSMYSPYLFHCYTNTRKSNWKEARDCSVHICNFEDEYFCDTFRPMDCSL